MFTALPTASVRVCELLGPPFHFCIPPFQRPYSWTTREAGQLLEDVLAASGADDDIAADPDYFFGTILLLDTSAAAGPIEPSTPEPRDFEIVDGQQRLITLTILACVLRDADDALDPETRDRLDALVTHTLNDNNQRRHRVTLRGREQDFLAEHVQTPGACASDPDTDGLNVGEQAILAVRNHFKAELVNLNAAARSRLVAYLCDSCHMVVILTRDVDRAHRMFMVLNERGKPLLRNDILKAEVMHNVPEAQAPRLVEGWERLSASLGPEFETLFSHVRLIHGHARPQVIAAIRQLVRESGDTMRFLDDILTPSATAFRQILDAGTAESALPPEIDRRLYYLKRVKGAEWVPAAMLVLERFRSDPAETSRLIGEIDRLAHVLRLLCLGTGKRQRRMAAVIDAIKSNAVFADAPCFEITRDEQRSIAFNLRDLYGRNQVFSKLVIMRIGDLLDGRLAPIEPADVTVEHILPQRPGTNSQWRRIIADPALRDTATKSLGNLAVVAHAVNDKARNKEFDRKRELYGASHPMPPLLAEVAAAATWDLAAIRAREEKMLASLASLWRIDVKGAAMTG